MPSQTDWARVDAATPRDVAAQIAEDPKDWITEADATIVGGIPGRIAKERVNIRLDADVLDFFRSAGPGYQTRINEVLKVFIRRSPTPSRKHRSARR